MRRIIDELVDKRKYNNESAYNKLMGLPYSMMDVKDYRNSIKLDKGLAGETKPANIHQAVVARNILNVEGNETPSIIVRGKVYELTQTELIVIRAHILSAVSCTKSIGQAYGDAITDWLEGNESRITEKQSKESLQNNLYYEAYNALNGIISFRALDVDTAIRNMSGE